MAKIKFGTDGWRGVISEDYTFANVRLVAAGIADWVKRREEQAKGIVVGYDGRFLSAKYAQDCAAVLADEGVKVWLADAMLSSPALTWQVKDRQAAGGVMITASHNPASWNALKFIEASGTFLSEVRAEELFDIYHQQDFPQVAESEIRSVALEPYPVEAHFKKIINYVDTQKIGGRRFRVAADCCNGVGAVHSPFFLRTMLGCNVVPIYDTPSGIFEREP